MQVNAVICLQRAAYEDEPGDEPERDDEAKEPDEAEPWAKTSSGDADEI